MHVRRPGPWFDLPVAVTMMACWLTIAVGWLHVAFGIALTLTAAMHLATRPGGWRWVTASARNGKRIVLRLFNLLLFAMAVTMLGTGVLRWVGVSAAASRHAVFSYLFLFLAMGHLAWMVPRLRRRLVSGGPRRRSP